jgi:aromatic ring-opening dioxygenase catalytic subunit (LigB family)
VLIIGSGLSYHNLARFGPGARTPSETFDEWLSDALSSAPERRSASVMAWEQAPYARVCHPREDHLAPLFVALGAAENETATLTYHERESVGGVTASSYRFG